MDLLLLLNELELDVREFKYLTKSYLEAHSSSDIKVLLDRNVLQLHKKLDEISLFLNDSQKTINQEKSPVGCSKEIVDNVLNEEMSKQIDEIDVVHTLETEEQTENDILKSSTVNDVERDVEAPSILVLGDRLFSKDDLRKMMSLNDSFRFARELFRGDIDLMNVTLTQIQMKQSFEDAFAYINSTIEISEEDEAGADFILLLKKYFS